MRTRRTTRRAQVLEAHAVVIGALLSALARLIHWRCRQMRLAAGPACIRRVSPRAHTIPHTTAHTGTCSGAHTCARLPMSTCATSHTHTAPLSATTHLCAHAHMHMHTARQTASHTQTGYHRKDTPRHTHAVTRLLLLLGSRHTTRPAHAGVGGHHTTVSPLFFIAYPQTRVPAPSMLGPYADATGRSLQPMLDCSKPGPLKSTNPYPISPDPEFLSPGDSISDTGQP